MEHRIDITLADLGRDPANADQLLTHLQADRPEMGPVIAIDTEDGTLTITLGTDAPGAMSALVPAKAAVDRALTATGLSSGLSAPRVAAVHVVEVAGERELELA